MKRDRINSLTGLRALAMMTIFCSHLMYLAKTPFHGLYSWIDNGRFGVNFFLVLSGFVLALGYSNKLHANNALQDLRFVRKRIQKIYIPYLISLILALPLYVITVTSGEGSLDVKLLISRLIINIGMIQSIIPFAKYSASINEVSWFISTIFIIYLFTPWFLRLNNKAAKHYTLFRLLCFVLAVLALYCCVYMVIREIEYVRFADRYLSIIYINPLIRVFPFLLGIIAYNVYHLLGDFRIKNGSFVEVLALAVFFSWWIIANHTGLPTVITECADMLFSMLVVLIFAFSKRGIVSILLSKEKMLGLGNISLEFYLVHYLVINYGMIIAKHVGCDKGPAIVLLTLLFFALSLYGAFLIHSFAEWLFLALRKIAYGKTTVSRN